MRYLALPIAVAVLLAASAVSADAQRGGRGGGGRTGGGGMSRPAPSRPAPSRPSGGSGFNMNRDIARPSQPMQRPGGSSAMGGNRNPGGQAGGNRNPGGEAGGNRNNGNRNNANNNGNRNNANNNGNRNNGNNSGNRNNANNSGNRNNANNSGNRTNVNNSGNRTTVNNNGNRTVINNPVYVNNSSWGWNHGVAWAPASYYWGGGFWGAMAIGVTSAAVYGAIVSNGTTYNSYQVQPSTPGYTFLSNYQLVQVQCGPANLVVVYGPQNSVICANPNNLVSAGNYQLNTETLSLQSI